MDLVPFRLFARPVGIAREHGALLRQPFLQEVAAALRRRLRVELAARRLHRLARDDPAGAEHQADVPQRRERLLQHDHAGFLVLHLDMVERRPVAGIGRFRLRVGHALEGELHVVGGDRAEAVGPHQAVDQRELDMRVVDLLQARRAVQLPGPFVAGLHAGETDEDVAHDVVFRRRLAVGRVEVLDVAVGAHPQDLAVLRQRDPRIERGGQPGRRHGSENLPPGETQSSSPCPLSLLCTLSSGFRQDARRDRALATSCVRRGRAECGSPTPARIRALPFIGLKCAGDQELGLRHPHLRPGIERDAEIAAAEFLAPMDARFGRERIVGVDRVEAARPRTVFPVEILDMDETVILVALDRRPAPVRTSRVTIDLAPAGPDHELPQWRRIFRRREGREDPHPPPAAGAPATPARSRRRSR